MGMVACAVLRTGQTTKNAKSSQETGFTLDRTKRQAIRQRLLEVEIYDWAAF